MSYPVTARGKIANLRDGHSASEGDQQWIGYKALFLWADRCQGSIPAQVFQQSGQSRLGKACAPRLESLRGESQGCHREEQGHWLER